MATPQSFTTVDDYISAFPEEVREILEKLRQTIRTAAPEATETISYDIPAFDLNGRHLVFFAGWKRHVSVYPLPAGDAAFQEHLGHYKRGRGSVQFPLNKPIPYDLVADIVRFLRSEKSAGDNQ